MANKFKTLTKNIIMNIGEEQKGSIEFYEFNNKHTMCVISSAPKMGYNAKAYFVGFSTCHESDKFDKWNGRFLAIDRAYAAYGKNTTTNIDFIRAIYYSMSETANIKTTAFNYLGKKV